VAAHFYDSVVWRWVAGPIVFIALTAAASVWIFGESIGAGIAFRALMSLFVIVVSRLGQRRRRGSDRTEANGERAELPDRLAGRSVLPAWQAVCARFGQRVRAR
jgi:hypothetical protein